MKTLVAFLLCGVFAVAADLAGKWNVVWDTPGGERRSTLTFRVDGDKVEADMQGARKPIAGTVRDGKVELQGAVYSQEAGGQGPFKLSGRLDGSHLKGSASWSEHSMTFTATRAE